jgi:hypothetical protein
MNSDGRFILIVIILGLFYLGILITSSIVDGNSNKTCANTCDVVRSKRIEDKCHCKTTEGWKEVK